MKHQINITHMCFDELVELLREGEERRTFAGTKMKFLSNPRE